MYIYYMGKNCVESYAGFTGVSNVASGCITGFDFVRVYMRFPVWVVSLRHLISANQCSRVSLGFRV
jgi:hypothetical protein